jgi:hypothetical protein
MNKSFSLHPEYKMLRNIVLLLFVLFLYSKTAWSVGNCSGTYSADELGERHNCQVKNTLTVQSGVTIKYGNNDITVILQSGDDDVTIENSGTIYGKNYTIKALDIENFEINNYSGGDIASDKSRAISLFGVADVRINNYGTIQSDTWGAIHNDNASTGDIYIHNEGTIKTNTQTLGSCTGAGNIGNICRSAIGITGGGGTTTIVNSGGTIESTNDGKAAITINDTANAIITLNSGTLQSAGSTKDIVIVDSGDETGTTINLGGSPTFTNGIDTNDTIVTIVLKNDISAAFSVNLYNSIRNDLSDGNLTITDNLPANYTWSLTEEDLDSDGEKIGTADFDDGVLSIIRVTPLVDKDVVGSIEAQVDMAKQIIQHSTIPVLDRIEWLRRHKEESNLSHQGIKVLFTNPMFSSISDALPVSTYFNPTAEMLPNNWAMWTEGSVTIGKTSGTDSASLKDIESTGITIGADKKVGLDLVHGFALRFGRDEVDVGSSGTSLDTDSYSLSVYRTRSYSEKIFLDSLLGISNLKTDLIRKNGAHTLTGRRYGRQIFGSLSYSGVIKKNQFNLSPSVRLDGGYTNLSSYSETGTDAVTYDTHNIKTGRISTGILLDDTIQFSSATLRPNGRLEYGADFSPSSNAVLSYVSDPNTDYTLSVKKEALHNFRAGVGFDIETVGGLSVTTFYERNQAVHSGYSDTMRLGIEQHLNANIHYALSYDGNIRFNLQTTSDGFNVNFKLEYSATGEIPHQLASLSLVRSF